MKRIFFTSMTLIIAACFMACGDSGAGNKPANAPANNANTAAPVNTAAIEADLKKLVTETAAALAKNDTAALERIYADNYTLVNLDGSVQNRTDRLGSIKSGDTKFDSFVYDEVNVRVNAEGTGAVVVSKATATGMNKGKKLEGAVRVTQVWAKTKAGWQQVSGHATQITAAADKTALSNKARVVDAAATDDAPPAANAPKKK